MDKGLVLLVLLNITLLIRCIRYKPTVDDEKRHIYKKGQFSKLSTLWRMIRSSGDCNPNLTLDHTLSILIHTLVVTAIYLYFNNFMLALLFSVHPVNIQVSTWLNGKRYAISTLLVLFMLHTMPYGIILYPLLSYFQISGLLTPVFYSMAGYWWVIIVYPILFAFGSSHILRQIGNRYLKHAPAGELRNSGGNKIIIGVKTFGFYTLHILVPTKVAFLHTFLDGFGNSKEENRYWYKLNWHFWRGLILVLICTITCITQWHTPVGKGMFWYLLFIAQWCNYPISITQSVTDRYCYLPSIGLLSVLVYILPMPVLLVYGGYLLAKHIQTMPSYNGIDNTLRHNAYTYPTHHRVRVSLAERYLKRHLFMSAYAECQIGLQYKPKDFKLLTLCAKTLILLDKVKYGSVIDKLLSDAKLNFTLGTESNCRKYVQILTDMQKNWEGFDYEKKEQN